MLTCLEVSNFKSIDYVKLYFRQENIIVGPNGTGKSNLLDTLKFARDAVENGLDEAVAVRHGIDSVRRWSKTRPYHVSIKLNFDMGDGRKGYFKFVLASRSGEFFVHEEEVEWRGRNPFAKDDSELSVSHYKRDADGQVEFKLDTAALSNLPAPKMPETDLFMTQLGPKLATPFAFIFRDLFSEISDYGAYSIYPNIIRSPQPINTSDRLSDDGSNLASVIRKLRATATRSNRENLTSALSQVLPPLSEIRIQTTGGFYVPTFKVDEPGGDLSHYLNMSQVSDGTLRMLGMLTAFYQANPPGKIALEEPEQMIHPGLLTILVEGARDYLEAPRSQRQIFLTTHSPTLLDMFESDSIIAAQWADGVSNFYHLSERQRKLVKDKLFSAGELMLVEGLFA